MEYLSVRCSEKRFTPMNAKLLKQRREWNFTLYNSCNLPTETLSVIICIVLENRGSLG